MAGFTDRNKIIAIKSPIFGFQWILRIGNFIMVMTFGRICYLAELGANFTQGVFHQICLAYPSPCVRIVEVGGHGGTLGGLIASFLGGAFPLWR